MKPFVLIIGWITYFHSLAAECRWVLEMVQIPASKKVLAPNLCLFLISIVGHALFSPSCAETCF